MLILVSDYIVQPTRFQMLSGFGCGSAADNSVLSLLLVYTWLVILPLISITIYYRMSTAYIDMI